ncbi:MAG TPA: hypothetical protein VKU00_18950 [Chthonomonadaceae bacterium]|nr:hypothetical protein [Chthonomonadaceae bacterium]
MPREIPDFKALHIRQQTGMTEQELFQLLDAGRAWNLAPILQQGGAILFPHTTLQVCGHQIAAAVHACLDCGAKRVLALGVLHALTEELEEARKRVAQGGRPDDEPSWGIQGPGLMGREDWRREFSLLHFQFLWEAEAKRRSIDAPELLLRYPSLAGGHPERLPDIGELQEIVKDAAVVVTTDAFHHGSGYGDPPESALAPEEGGIELARRRILEGYDILRLGDYEGYQQHCVATRSDGRDVGQALRYLRGPMEAALLDIVADDMTGPYNKPAPTWVAGALVALTPQAAV